MNVDKATFPAKCEERGNANFGCIRKQVISILKVKDPTGN
jgi:hypothetical protein